MAAVDGTLAARGAFMYRYVLTEVERENVQELAEKFSSSCQVLDNSEIVASLHGEAQRLPEGLRIFLASARSKEIPVFAVSGLPVSCDLPPTPKNWQSAQASNAGKMEEIILLLCAAILGDPFGWASQQRGRLIQDVMPTKGREDSLTNASSQKALNLHTEDVYHPCRCDYVGLMCLRNPSVTGTTICSIQSLSITDRLASILRESRFRFYPDDSHAENYDSGETSLAAERDFEEGPILLGPTESPYLRIDPDFTAARPNDIEAETAIHDLANNLSSSSTRAVIMPGEAIFLDNYQVVHGRDPFTPRYDGTDRWLKRVNIIRDIRRAYIFEQTTSRILSAQITPS